MTSLPILLPDGFNPTVVESDTVAVGQVIAERPVTWEVVLPLADLLDVPNRKIKKILRVSPGESVMPGDVLAKTGTFLKERKITSTIAGVVSQFNQDNGTLTLFSQENEEGTETDGETNLHDTSSVETIKSPIDGQVTMCNNEQIVLSTDKHVLLGTDSVGKAAEGILQSLFDDQGTGGTVTPQQLDVSIIGNVLFGFAFSREVLLKAIGMDAAGIIGVHMQPSDLEYITKRNITTPVIVIDEEMQKKVAKLVGKKVYIDGETTSILELK